MKLSINGFKNIQIFTYRTIYHTLKNESRNISNTSEELLNFIETFDVQLDDNDKVTITSDNGEYELNMFEVVLYDPKNKLYVTMDDEFYYELIGLYKSLTELSKE